FGRTLFWADTVAPRESLAVLHAGLNKPEEAWQYAEENLARGLLDDLAGIADPVDVGFRSQVEKIDEQLLPLFGAAKLSEEKKRLREELIRQRQDILNQLSKRSAIRSAALVLPRVDIQKAIPTDGALVFWVASMREWWGCVLRREGLPLW